MNTTLFFLVASLCAQDYSSTMCQKTNEAFLKQEGYWQQGQHVSTVIGNNTKEAIGKTPAFVLGTAALIARDKKIKLAFGPEKVYNISVDKNYNALISATWRFN